MSHLAIGEVSETLRHALWLGLRADLVTNQLVTSEQNIVLANPGQVALPQGVVRQLSLWLYQVLPNEHLRNQPPVRRGHQPVGVAAFRPGRGRRGRAQGTNTVGLPCREICLTRIRVASHAGVDERAAERLRLRSWPVPVHREASA